VKSPAMACGVKMVVVLGKVWRMVVPW
jgi:hypothetical protein